MHAIPAFVFAMNAAHLEWVNPRVRHFVVWIYSNLIRVIVSSVHPYVLVNLCAE